MFIRLFRKKRKSRRPYPADDPELRNLHIEITKKIEERRRNGERVIRIIEDMAKDYDLSMNTLKMIYYGYRN